MSMRLPRKPRRDRGIVKANARDMQLIAWIADQYAIRFDHLLDLAREYPGPGANPEGISVSAVRQMVARWLRAGWVESRQLLAGEPAWLWVSKSGLKSFGHERYTAQVPAFSRIRHLYAVNEVRLLVEEDYAASGEAFEWVSERALRAGTFYQKGETGNHTPDALIHTREGTIAVEVELTQKKPDDLAHIINTMLSAYDLIRKRYLYCEIRYYVFDSGVLRALRAAVDRQAYSTLSRKVRIIEMSYKNA
jgi:hypothetical protein